MKQNKPKGFTLLEAMIVIVIIGLLLAMLIPVWQQIRSGQSLKKVGSVQVSAPSQLFA
jgi:prepilin-type N-terminal cleavage/methylation domain-containing protein